MNVSDIILNPQSSQIFSLLQSGKKKTVFYSKILKKKKKIIFMSVLID